MKADFLSQKLIFHCLKKKRSRKSKFFFIFVHMNVQNFWHIYFRQKNFLQNAMLSYITAH